MTWQATVLTAAALGTMMFSNQGKSGATAPSGVEPMRAEIVRAYPHDRAAFTQGLVLDGGRLYESTGLVGQSSLREVELESGRVIRKIDVAPPIFAEGLALVDDRLIQLTWRNERALLYDRRTFTKLGEVSYRGEGWGLCRDGSDARHERRFVQPHDPPARTTSAWCARSPSRWTDSRSIG